MYALKDISAIVVLYDFDGLDVKKNVEQLLKNFTSVILINNSPEISLSSFTSKKIIKINNSCNTGLAFALNQGIQIAIKKGVRLVAFFDQDTLINDSFNQTMLANINLLKNKKIALYAPLCFNHSTNQYLFQYYIKKFSVIRKLPSMRNFVSYPDFVITSGSYIPVKVINDIGDMDTNLFINLIDTEWCFRARSRGYKIANFSNCIVDHYIGDYYIELFDQRYAIHSPLRLYYTFRNSWYCLSLKHIGSSWKLREFYRNMFRFLFYMLFVKNRATYVKYIIKGYYPGFIKKMGKLEE